MLTKKTWLLISLFTCVGWVLKAQTKSGTTQQVINRGSKSKTHKLTFKNEAAKDMYIAIVYYDRDPKKMGEYCYYSKGWFKVQKGKSIWMNATGRQFYYHAHQVGNKKKAIGSEKEFYAHPTKLFNIKRASAHRKGAKYETYEVYKFDKIPESKEVTLK